MFNAKEFLSTVSNAPGVYQMFDAAGNILYVGKAKNLKKRLSSYFRAQVDQPKTSVLVKHIESIRIIITQSENEALILENNLIKAHKPRYNILFKDDKNYPYLVFSQHRFPRLDLIRTHKTPQGEYFGPFSNSSAVKQTLHLIEKLFLLRNCSDSFFANRSRPCLQYHIKRCSAPCVNNISPADYHEAVKYTKLFLQGKNVQIIEALRKEMESAAEKMDFEKAAFYRDQIQMLRHVESEQTVQKGHGDFDIVAAASKEGHICIQLLRIRSGKIVGSFAYFHHENVELPQALEYFIAQHFLNAITALPKQIYVNTSLNNQDWLNNALSEQSGYKVSIKFARRGVPLNLMRMAEYNAGQTLFRDLAQKSSQKQRFEALEKILDLPKGSLLRIECFDISHTFGEATVASCVVFDENGPNKKDYRLFNIRDITAGDDFTAMRQVLERRYRHLSENLAPSPDVVIIDGGKGQLSQAIQVFEAFNIRDIILLGIAKGPTRKAGLEVIWQAGHEKPLAIDPHSPAMHLIQHVRDEAHRFAIAKHRAKRGKSKQTSVLENISGIGSKKRQALLKHFGGLQGLKNASVMDIAKVEGIGIGLAEKIAAHLR